MAFMQGDNKYRPRSKKEKQRLQAQRKRELAAKRERQQLSQQAGSSFTPNYDYPRRNQHINISSSTPKPEPRQELERIEYDEEMLAREQAAQAEAERRKKCIAPAFNKGPYQYVGSTEEAKLIGRS